MPEAFLICCHQSLPLTREVPLKETEGEKAPVTDIVHREAYLPFPVGDD